MTYTTGVRALYTGPFWSGSDIIHFARALGACGAIVRILDDTTIFPGWNSFASRVMRRLFLRRLMGAEWNRQLLSLVDGFKPDVVFITNAHFCWPETLVTIRRKEIPLLCFYHDPQWKGRDRNRFAENISYFDLVVTTRSWQAKEFEAAGARNTKVIRFGYDPLIHQPIGVAPLATARYKSDVAFIGTYRPRRAAELSALVQTNFSHRLRVWGGGWNRLPPDAPMLKHWEGRAIHEEEIPVIYATAKVALNWLQWEPTSLDTSLRQGDQHTPRSFQIPACGGAMMIAQRTDDHLCFFREDKEAVYFDNVDELREKLNFWLTPAQDEARKAIAAAARARCITEDYSYVPVFRELLQYFDLPAAQ
jgi:spore maturation protein CgeB